MKKIILLLFCFIIILSGCGSNEAYTSTGDAIDAGYTRTDHGVYELETTDDSVVGYVINTTVDNEEDNEEVISVDVKLTIDDSSYIFLSYDDSTASGWNAYLKNSNTGDSIDLEPNDAYAYIEAVEPKAIKEFNKLFELGAVDTIPLEGGDKAVVEEIISTNQN